MYRKDQPKRSSRAQLRVRIAAVGGASVAVLLNASSLTAQPGAQNPPTDSIAVTAVVRGAAVDSTLVFDWSVLPRVADHSSGLLNKATVTVRFRSGEAVAALPLRIVIGASAGSYGDSRIENAVLTTDAGGRASFDMARIAGEARVVYLAVQSIRDGQTSPATVLLLGAADVAKVEIEQHPSARVSNGGSLGDPRVRVRARDGTFAKDVAVVAVRTGGTARLSGEIARTGSDGVASFANLRARADCAAATCGVVSLQFRAGNEGSEIVSVALAIPPVKELTFASAKPDEVFSGGAIPPITIVALSADNVPVPGAPIVVRSYDGQSLGTSTTDASGAATFSSLRLSAKAGANGLRFLSGSASIDMPLTVRPGRASRIEVLGQPPTRIAFETLLSPAPMVKVTDAAGNAIAGVTVKVSLRAREVPRLDSIPKIRDATQRTVAVKKAAAWEVTDLHLLGASIGGTTIKESGGDGRIIFDDLKIRARTSELKLLFEVVDGEDGDTASSNAFVHDPQTDYDNNLVGISAIKTISGVAPESEFFDLRFRFRLPLRLHVMSHVDLALTSRQDTSKVSSPQKRLTEASLLLNSPARFTTQPDSDVPERLVSVGGQLKVFGTVPYWGAHVVAMELGGSPFQGSSLAVAWLRRWSTDTLATVNGDTLHLARHNLGIDFFVRSATVDFFKILTIRGSIIAPFDKKVRLTSRIAIAVPIGSVVRF